MLFALCSLLPPLSPMLHAFFLFPSPTLRRVTIFYVVEKWP